MLQRIARLAIAAPRRIVGLAVLVFIAAAVFGIPVADSLSPGGFQDPNSESARAIQVLTDKFGQSGQQMLILVTAPGGRQQRPGPQGGHRPRRPAATVAVGVQRDLALDRTAGRLSRSDQHRRQVGCDRGQRQRRRKLRAEKRPNPFGSIHPRPRQRHRPRRRPGDAVRPDQQAKPRRPAVDGDDRAPADLPGAGLGVRWAAGGGVADGPRRTGRRRLDVGVASSSRSPPTCRSSRST